MNEDQAKKFQQLVARSWTDESFKQTLLSDPMATLKAEGMTPPAGINVKVIENTDTTFHLVIPARPTDLSDAELDNVAAAGFCFCDNGGRY